MTKKYTKRDITRWDPEIDTATWTWDSIGTLATVRAAERLEVVEFHLSTIVSLLRSIGNDGLHDILRDMAREVRAKKKRRLARLRRALAARRALKVAA